MFWVFLAAAIALLIGGAVAPKNSYAKYALNSLAAIVAVAMIVIGMIGGYAQLLGS